ncbi:TetR/AcrR family transcriptional regulator, partial [Mycobacteroides abscessus]
MLLNEADDPIDARVLDAAAGLIGDRGERNVTMSHIVL